MSQLDPQALVSQLNKLQKAKARMALAMAPEEHADLCRRMDALRADVAKALASIRPPQPLAEEVSSAPKEVQDQAAEIEKAADYVRSLQAVNPLAETSVAIPRDFTTFGVSVERRTVPTEARVEGEFADWVYELAESSLPTTKEPSQSPNPLLQEALAAAQSIFRGLPASPVSHSVPLSADELEQKVRESLTSWSKWLDASSRREPGGAPKSRGWGDILDK